MLNLKHSVIGRRGFEDLIRSTFQFAEIGLIGRVAVVEIGAVMWIKGDNPLDC